MGTRGSSLFWNKLCSLGSTSAPSISRGIPTTSRSLLRLLLRCSSHLPTPPDRALRGARHLSPPPALAHRARRPPPLLRHLLPPPNLRPLPPPALPAQAPCSRPAPWRSH